MADDGPPPLDEAGADGPPDLDEGGADEDVGVGAKTGKGAKSGGAGGAGGGGGGDDDDDDDDDDEEGDDKGKQNRSEKKSRKAVIKLGMKQIANVTRITMKKAQNILFVMTKPEVFKAPGSDAYIIFGESKIENMSDQAKQLQEQARLQQPDAGRAAAPKAAAAARPAATLASADEGGAAGDDDGPVVEEKDIMLVIGQADCTRERAIWALKRNDNDIVNSIMELTGT